MTVFILVFKEKEDNNMINMYNVGAFGTYQKALDYIDGEYDENIDDCYYVEGTDETQYAEWYEIECYEVE